MAGKIIGRIIVEVNFSSKSTQHIFNLTDKCDKTTGKVRESTSLFERLRCCSGSGGGEEERMWQPVVALIEINLPYKSLGAVL